MSSLPVLIDPTSEGTGTELAINDGAPGGSGYVLHASPDLTPPSPKPIWIDSYDTEGSIAADDETKYDNRTLGLTVRVYGTSAADLEANLGALYGKVGKINRHGGTLLFTTAADTEIIFDLLPEVQGGATFDETYLRNNRCDVELKLTAKPLWRELEQGNVTDDFSADTIGSGLWATFFGSGVTVTGGQLVASTTSEKRLRRTDVEVTDGQVTVKHVTPSVFGVNYIAGVIVKWLDASNFIYARIVETGAARAISFRKVDGGSESNLATLTAPAALATSTAYFLRARLTGNDITVQHLNSTGAVLTGGGTATLAGADATKFGQGVRGSVGVTWTPFDTSARLDDFSVSPNVYIETALAALVFPFVGPRNGVPALGRLVVTDLSGNDQWQVDVGLQVETYDAAATAALHIAGTDLTPLGSSTDTGTAIRNTDLVPTWQAIASASGLTHKGSFRPKIKLQRPTGNTGEVSVRLEWGTGDYRTPTRNEITTYAVGDREGVDTWLDCGPVNIPKDTDSWEFRVLAKSTVTGDEIDAKDVWLYPTERYIELAALVQFETPSAFSALSTFDTEAGAITGDSASVGGVWDGDGDTDDYTVAGGVAIRTAVSDAFPGRLITLPVSMTATTVQMDFKTSTIVGTDLIPMPRQGIAARRVGTDANNFAFAQVVHRLVTGLPVVNFGTFIGGAMTVVASAALPLTYANTWYTIRLQMDAAGRYYVWVYPQDGMPITAVLSGQLAVLATGGSLATGQPGIIDYNNDSGASTRSYDNFLAFSPAPDAAIFASQSLELRHDGVSRENGAGTSSGPISNHGRGRFLRIPAGDTGRMVVKGYRNDPATMADPAADDIQAQLFITERGLLVPA